jgi:3-hydroxyisobutyrate dehydrogenase-like beta-hydroxyacid dehydrogenase
LLLGERAGMDGNALLEVLREGAAYSRVMDHKGEKMLRGDFSPQARLAQHLKDVGLILELGERTGAPLPLSTLHAQVLQKGVEEGLGELDNSAVVEVLRLLGERGEGREDEEGERRGER